MKRLLEDNKKLRSGHWPVGEGRPGNQTDCPLCLIIWERKEFYLFSTFSWEKINSSVWICHRHKRQTCVVTSGESVKGAVKTFAPWTHKIKKNSAFVSALSYCPSACLGFLTWEGESASQEHLKDRDCLWKEESSQVIISKAFSMYALYWVGQEICLGFSTGCYGKSLDKLFGQPNIS